MFDMVADLNKLTPAQKKGHLLLVFDIGTLPHKLVSDSPASEDFVVLKDKLISVFKSKYVQFDRMSAFKSRVQVSTESI